LADESRNVRIRVSYAPSYGHPERRTSVFCRVGASWMNPLPLSVPFSYFLGPVLSMSIINKSFVLCRKRVDRLLSNRRRALPFRISFSFEFSLSRRGDVFSPPATPLSAISCTLSVPLSIISQIFATSWSLWRSRKPAPSSRCEFGAFSPSPSFFLAFTHP